MGLKVTQIKEQLCLSGPQFPSLKKEEIALRSFSHMTRVHDRKNNELFAESNE